MANASAAKKPVCLDFGSSTPAGIVHSPEMRRILAIGPFSGGRSDENPPQA